MADPVTDAYNATARGNYGHVLRSVIIPGYEIARPKTYDQRYYQWQLLRDCFEGESRMKAQSAHYLKKLSAHDDNEHDTYVQRAYFYNAVRRTHIGLVGSIFRKPPEFKIPNRVKLDIQHVTLDGQSLRTFSRKVAAELLLVGRFGALADFKSDPKNAYLVGYEAEDIYAWRYRIHNDKRIVDRIVLLEREATQTDFSETHTEIVRILRLDDDPDAPGQLRYSQTVIRPDAADAKQVTVTDVPFNSKGRVLRYIPFVFFNPASLEAECEAPPMYDIATLNVSHFQSTAHLEHGRFYAGMPTYVTSGEVEEAIEGLGSPNPRRVGPSTVWELEKDAKAWILEFTGHGLTFLENAVDSKQLQMQSLGGKLISSTRRAAAMSDEAWQLLETGDEATLMDVAYQLDEGVTHLLNYLAHIRGDQAESHSDDMQAEFNKEFVRSELTARELRALQSLYERGIIPLDVMYYALREVGVIPQEYTLEDFSALIKKKDQIYEPPPLPVPPAPSPFRNPSGGAPSSGPAGPGGTRPPAAPKA